MNTGSENIATATDNGTIASAAAMIVAAALSGGMGHENTGTLLDTVLVKLKGEQEVPETVAAPEAAQEKQRPVVSVRKSLADPNFIVCLFDGKQLKTLKRHLMSKYGMTPEQYREYFNLPSDYPMVAQSYSESRRDLARAIGLGRKPGAKKTTRKPRATKQTETARTEAEATA